MNPTLLREGAVQAISCEGRICLQKRFILLSDFLVYPQRTHSLHPIMPHQNSAVRDLRMLPSHAAGQYPQLGQIIHQIEFTKDLKRPTASLYELIVQLNGHNNLMLDKLSDNDDRGDTVRWSGNISAKG